MSKYKDPQELIVEAVRIGKNQTWESVFAGSKIVFILEGLLLMELPERPTMTVQMQYFIFIPKGVCIRYSTLMNSLIVIADVQRNISPCERYYRSDLDCKQDQTKQVHVLDRQLTAFKMNELMHTFARELNRALSIKEMSKQYFEIKIHECLILLRLCYGIVIREEMSADSPGETQISSLQRKQTVHK